MRAIKKLSERGPVFKTSKRGVRAVRRGHLHCDVAGDIGVMVMWVSSRLPWAGKLG